MFFVGEAAQSPVFKIGSCTCSLHHQWISWNSQFWSVLKRTQTKHGELLWEDLMPLSPCSCFSDESCFITYHGVSDEGLHVPPMRRGKNIAHPKSGLAWWIYQLCLVTFFITCTCSTCVSCPLISLKWYSKESYLTSWWAFFVTVPNVGSTAPNE